MVLLAPTRVRRAKSMQENGNQKEREAEDASLYSSAGAPLLTFSRAENQRTYTTRSKASIATATRTESTHVHRAVPARAAGAPEQEEPELASDATSWGRHFLWTPRGASGRLGRDRILFPGLRVFAQAL